MTNDQTTHSTTAAQPAMMSCGCAVTGVCECGECRCGACGGTTDAA